GAGAADRPLSKPLTAAAASASSTDRGSRGSTITRAASSRTDETTRSAPRGPPGSRRGRNASACATTNVTPTVTQSSQTGRLATARGLRSEERRVGGEGGGSREAG